MASRLDLRRAAGKGVMLLSFFSFEFSNLLTWINAAESVWLLIRNAPRALRYDSRPRALQRKHWVKRRGRIVRSETATLTRKENREGPGNT